MSPYNNISNSKNSLIMREQNLMYSSKPPTATLALFTRKCLATSIPIRAPCLTTSFNLVI